MNFKFRFFRQLFLFVLFSGIACAGFSCSRLETVQLRIERKGKEPVSIRTELARTDAQLKLGLMHRKKLADGNGMLFIFDRDQVMAFWMKDTLIPLSIAFIAVDGRIVEIKDMAPLDLNTVFSSRSVRYALEVPQGWFGRAGISPGDVLDLKEVRDVQRVNSTGSENTVN
ncbi:MAG: DUF192 domain-containing protein [Treponema sp.]|nr:DUF192 domain-containing protein [Treponema sp.]